MNVIWSPDYEVDIGAHVFPTRKYRLVRARLLSASILPESAFVEPQPVDEVALARVHTAEYLRKIRESDLSAGERWQLEVPFSAALVRAMRLCCGGTLLCGRLALEHGVSVHLGGGFHHAFADHGEGFCLLNDVAVAAASLLSEGAVERVVVVDLDVHHGNGTAAIFADDERVFTFSMHQQANYPAVKPPSDLDVGLADRTGDDEYLERLEQGLDVVLRVAPGGGSAGPGRVGRGRTRGGGLPDIVFYLAGADPYREDQLGGLGLTLEGLRRRDRTVFGRCRDAGVPVATVLAGGYAVNSDDTVIAHSATVEEAIGITT